MKTQQQDPLAPAEAARKVKREAAQVYLKAVRHLTDLQKRRAHRKDAAITRLMAPVDQGGKGWAYSRADGLCQLDPEYDSYKREVEAAEHEARKAYLALEDARDVLNIEVARFAQHDSDEVRDLIGTMRTDMERGLFEDGK